ncbi:MAG: cell division protein ZapA [Bacteroidales bacterium]|nr:cell division protein ZapA [Bacteroidales bacterium]
METSDIIHINLEILQRNIDLWIKREYESYYREAEKRINEKATAFAQKWNVTDQQDLLSKLLIEITVNYIAKEERLNNYEANLIPQMEKLSLLADKMNEALEALEHEEISVQEDLFTTQNVD